MKIDTACSIAHIEKKTDVDTYSISATRLTRKNDIDCILHSVEFLDLEHFNPNN